MATTVYFGLLTPSSMASRDSGRKLLETILTATPEWAPEKYNYFEPINRPFDPTRLDAVLEAWRFSFLWRRRQPKVSGSVFFGGKHHSSMIIRVAQSAFRTSDAVNFLSLFRQHFPVDFAFVHLELGGDESDLTHYRTHVEPFMGPLSTARLKEGLPDLPWAAFFGRPYVELFGRERLVSAPAATIQEFPDGVYVQLTPDPHDARSRREDLERVRATVRAHIGGSAFAGDTFEPSQVPAFLVGLH